jgi:hypothetical protein
MKHCGEDMEEISVEGERISAPTYDTQPEKRITAIRYQCVICGREEWNYLDKPVYR